MRLSVALLGVALCLSEASGLNGKSPNALELGKGATGPSATSLLVAEPYQLSQISLEPASRRLIERGPHIGGLAYEARRHRVYWSEMSTGRVNARSLADAYGHGDELVYELSPLEWRPRALALDEAGDNLYVLDSRAKRVHALDLERKLRCVLVEAGQLRAPTDLALDPSEALMFVADGTRILAFGMDGSGARAVVAHPRYRIKSLALDTDHKRLLWSDLAFHRIKSAEYDGGDARVLLKNRLGAGAHALLGPAQLAYHNGSLYFYDDVYRSISALELASGRDARLVYDGLDVRAIRVLHPHAPAGLRAEPCDGNAGCPRLCLLASKLRGRIETKCASTCF